MPDKRRATVSKRERERLRQQRRDDKVTKRQQRQAERKDRPAVDTGMEDPDIAGIVPGPQPRQEGD
jgi:hypothetical protein